MPKPIAAPAPKRGRPFARTIYLAVGVLNLGLGILGAFLPVMPTTVFLIIATACFARSCPRLERWLLDHRRLGPALRCWRATRAIPRRAKLVALASMSLSAAALLAALEPGIWTALGLGILAVSAGVVLAWPSGSEERSDDGCATSETGAPRVEDAREG